MAKQATAKMIAFDNILFATDFSKRSSAALPFALSIAHRYGSKIFAVHVVAPPPLGTSPTLEGQTLTAQALREAHDSVKTLEPELGKIPHESLLRKGDIGDDFRHREKRRRSI